MTSLKDLIMAEYRKPDPNPFLFEVGQEVRLRVGRSLDGQTPEHYNGAMVQILSRYCTGLHKEHWYKVFHKEKNETCEFREDEFDMRFARNA
jgi:hypothetical protein